MTYDCVLSLGLVCAFPSGPSLPQGKPGYCKCKSGEPQLLGASCAIARAKRLERCQLFGHASLAQTLPDTFVLLLVPEACQRERNRRTFSESRYPSGWTHLLVTGKHLSSFVATTDERVGRSEESVGVETSRIGLERARERSDGFLVTPEKNKRVTPAVQPGPPPGVTRSQSISLGEPTECLFRPAEVQGRQPNFLVRPRLARILGDHRLVGGSQARWRPASPGPRCALSATHEVR